MDIKKLNPNHIIAVLIFTFVLVCYISIIAPSVSFWDCGEYIAAGATLGILHPPGNPLYVIFARIASSVFFFIENPALRINILSPLFGALSSLFIYLTIVRVLSEIAGPKITIKNRIAIYVGGIVGSLFAAFANTIVFSAVEAEVNVPLLLPVSICTWLAVKWGQSNSPHRDRILVLIAFICYLGISIHMYAMIVMPSIFLYVIIRDPQKRKDWRFLITTLCMGLVMYQMSLYLFIGIVLVLITFLFMRFSPKAKTQWKLCLYISAAAYLGFSVHFFIPVRSAMNPSIDMNHPATLQSFIDFLDRKQYGNESMVKRMFWRRGQWKNQFGIEGRMGFGGFFLTQFFRIDKNDTSVSFFAGNKLRGIIKLLIYLIPTGLMLYAWLALFRQKRSLAIFLIALTLSTTVILVIYMNFGDGTRPEYRDYLSWKNHGMLGAPPNARREVRVRDYFYIAGFMYYGMWLGIASGILLILLNKSKKRLLRRVSPFVTILILLSPSIALSHNLRHNNRRGDKIPYNYAWNLLMSCDKNAILFTYGDNDTYPLWALQEAFNIRKDIRVVNLSLLNTSWYIRQCKNKEPRVPISIADNSIDKLIPEPNPFLKDTHYTLAGAGIPVTIPGRKSKPAIYVNNKLVINIVDANRWKKPIYFASSIPADQFMGLAPYLSQEGMVYRITNIAHGSNPRYDTMRTEYLLDSIYKLDGFPAHRMEVDEASARATHIFSVLFLQCASERLRRASIRRSIIENYIKENQSDYKAEKRHRDDSNIIREVKLMKMDIKKGLGYLDARNRIFSDVEHSIVLRKHFTQLWEFAETTYSNTDTN